jgi:hypothetical protein
MSHICLHFLHPCVFIMFFMYHLLKKYVPDANHIIDWNVIQVEPEGDF